MMMLSSKTTASERVASLIMRKLISMRQSRSAELLWSRIVTLRDLRSVALSSLEPQRTCKHVTKLVPKLVPKVIPTEECLDVPKDQVPDQPEEGQEACGQEVVLCAPTGVRTGVIKCTDFHLCFPLKILSSSINNFISIRNITVTTTKVYSRLLLI